MQRGSILLRDVHSVFRLRVRNVERTLTRKVQSNHYHASPSIQGKFGGKYINSVDPWRTRTCICVRNLSSSEETKKETEGERNVKHSLTKSFPKATNITVEDISGGCGSMYQIYIESMEFAGLSTVKQHMMVNAALKKEIKEMHGVRIQTAIPKS